MAFPFGNTSSAQFGGTPNEPPNNSVVGPDLEEIQTEALGFQSISGETKLRLTPPWPSEALPPPTASLLSIAPQRGLLAAAGPDFVVVAGTDSVRQAFAAEGATEGNIKSFTPQLTLNAGMRVSHVVFSTDESYLVISAESGGGLAVYNVAGLMGGNVQAAFELSTNGSSLRALVPNPTREKAELFAIVTANGYLMIANLNSRQMLQAPQGPILKDGVSCVTWSNRGKQLVAGLGNGTCLQLTPEGEVKADIPRPSDLEGDQHVASIAWLENHLFLIAHSLSSSDPAVGNSNIFHLVTRQTSPQQMFLFQKLPEPCFSTSDRRLPPSCFFLRLRDFPPNLRDLILVISTASADVGLFSRSKAALTNDLPKEKITDVFTTTSLANDARRASLPVSENLLDVFAVGVALDLSSKDLVKRPIPGEEIEESPGPLPGLMVLNEEGILSAWWLVYADSIRQKTSYPSLIHAQGQPQQDVRQATFSTPDPQTTFGQPSFGSASTTGLASGNSSGFGIASSSGKPQSSWLSASSPSPTPQSIAPGPGQFGFGSPSSNGGAVQGVAFGTSGVVGNRPSPWATKTSGTAGASGVAFGQSGGAGMGNHSPFGSRLTGSAFKSNAGGFASFANSPGFAASAAQSGGESPFGKTIAGTALDSKMDTDNTFAGKNQGGEGLFKGDFVLGSTFKGDGTAANDLPKPTANASDSLFGSGFGQALGDSGKTPLPPPTQEAQMADSTNEKENIDPSSSAELQPAIIAPKSASTQLQLSNTAVSPGGGSSIAQSHENAVPTAEQNSTPTTLSTKPALYTTTPQESPAKSAGSVDNSAKFLASPHIGGEEGDDNHEVLATPAKRITTTPLPPESTSKASYTIGDSSSSSKSSAEDAPLPPDFLHAKSTLRESQMSPHPDTPTPLVDGEDDVLDDDEGSGVDVAQDISPLSDPNTSPRIVSENSFSEPADKSPPVAPSAEPSHSQPQKPGKPLFGEVVRTSQNFPPAAKLQDSPSSPSPIQPVSIGETLRPESTRSISVPARPSRAIANRKLNFKQTIAGRQAQMSLEEERTRRRDSIMAEQNRKAAEEQQELSDREDEKIREELATDVEPSLVLEPFLAHQDYVGNIDKSGIPGQVEALYRDINSMVDTLGINARSLGSFIKGHSQRSRQGSHSVEDLEADDWCLIEMEDIAMLEDKLSEQLNEGRLHAVQEKVDTCRELHNGLHKIRSKRHETAKLIDAKSDPKQLQSVRTASLNPHQTSIQHDLRSRFLQIQKLITEAEEKISLLKARLVSCQPNSSKSNPPKIPTVEAVTNTIKKMTSMVEQKTLNIDKLESQMRRLNLISVDELNGREKSSVMTSPISGRSSFQKSPSNFRKSTFSTSDWPGIKSKASKSTTVTPMEVDNAMREKAEIYKIKTQQRREINNMIKNVFLSSGPRITPLD